MSRVTGFLSLDRLYNYLGLLGGALLSALGGWDMPLKALVAAMGFDYLSGVLVAIRQKKLSSAVGFIGIARKTTVFGVVIVASALDALLGQPSLCRTAAISFYFVNESVSLLENAALLGVPVPQRVKDTLEQLRK